MTAARRLPFASSQTPSRGASHCEPGQASMPTSAFGAVSKKPISVSHENSALWIMASAEFSTMTWKTFLPISMPKAAVSEIGLHPFSPSALRCRNTDAGMRGGPSHYNGSARRDAASGRSSSGGPQDERTAGVPGDWLLSDDHALRGYPAGRSCAARAAEEVGVGAPSVRLPATAWVESTVKCGAIMQPFRFRTKVSTPDAIARTWRAGCHRELWFGFAA